MKAIIDSGGTKADWKIVQNSNLLASISSGGIQPFVQSKEEIKFTLDQLVKNHPLISELKEVYFYGSGCSDKKQQEYIADLIREVLPKAFIKVSGDLLGAAIACCGNKSGVVGILGTGSNSCLYDGKRIIQNVPSLGFILGDEGSGATIGKELVKSYFYGKMPKELEISFSKWIPGGRLEVLDKVYQKQNPNAYLASFAKFAYENKASEFIQNLVQTAFEAFVENQIKKYSFSPNNPVHFVGSIATHWKTELNQVLQSNGLLLGNIIAKPIDALTQYHMNNEYQHDRTH